MKCCLRLNNNHLIPAISYNVGFCDFFSGNCLLDAFNLKRCRSVTSSVISVENYPVIDKITNKSKPILWGNFLGWFRKLDIRIHSLGEDNRSRNECGKSTDNLLSNGCSKVGLTRLAEWVYDPQSNIKFCLEQTC